MTICQKCEQFGRRVKEWNCTHGVINPLPYIYGIIEPHRDLVFEGFEHDGAGCSVLTFRCLCCDQLWTVSAWRAVGSLEIWPQFQHINY
jgi:hypothetical protein